MDRHDVELVWYRLRRFSMQFFFGDRVGLAIFLGALVFFGVTWRTGFFINDNFSLANGLVNLVDGHFQFTHIAYGPGSGDSPGTYTDGSRVYARNYGLIVAAIPFYLALQWLSFVAAYSVLLIAIWSLLLLAFCMVVGQVVERQALGNYSGSALAVVLFTVNLAFVSPLDTGIIALLALQFVSMSAAAFVGVLLYRLLARMYTQRLGVVGGAFAVLATPVGFWATIPKRHVVIAMLVLASAYSLYRARADESLRFRALAYVWPALAAWVHPPDGLVLLVSLGLIDVVTHRKLALPELVAIGVVFLVALTPFLATNLAITGSPLEPPRFLADYKGQVPLDSGIPDGAQPAGGGSGSSGGTGGSGGDGTPVGDGDGAGSGVGGSGGTGSDSGGSVGIAGRFLGLLSALLSAAGDVPARLDRFEEAVTQGWRVVSDLDRMWEVFVRSGIDGTGGDEFRAIRLSVLESLPLAAIVVALPFGTGNSRLSTRVQSWMASPTAAVDLFGVLYGVFLALVYLPRLPLHATITVRYLVPAMPLVLYLGLRSVRARVVVQDALEPLLASYAVAVMLGLVLVGALTVDAVLIERMRLHALIATAIWPIVAVSFVLPDRIRGIVTMRAIGAGCAAGATTVFVLMARIAHYAMIGDHALPILDVIARVLTV